MDRSIAADRSTLPAPNFPPSSSSSSSSSTSSGFAAPVHRSFRSLSSLSPTLAAATSADDNDSVGGDGFDAVQDCKAPRCVWRSRCTVLREEQTALVRELADARAAVATLEARLADADVAHNRRFLVYSQEVEALVAVNKQKMMALEEALQTLHARVGAAGDEGGGRGGCWR